MRVTNVMTQNQILLNLNKSMNNLDYLQYQSATGNKIRYASDNPIIAGRSLKFRTNIVETEQYLSNVDQGRSWLQTSANAVKNVLEALVNEGETSLRSLLVSVGGTNTIADCKIYATQLKETLSEMKSELNASYAGRYIFSGFKTNEKPVFDVDNSRQIKITEQFDFSQIDNDYRVYVKEAVAPATDDNMAMPEEISCYRIKLAYDNGFSMVPTSLDSPAGMTITGPTPPATQRLSTDAGAYEPGPDDIYFLEDTGELIFGSNVYNDLSTEVPPGFSITYEKTGFSAGEINPRIFFSCEENGELSVIDGQYINYEFGINSRMAVNTLAKDLFPVGLMNDISDVIKLIDSINISDRDELINQFMSLPTPDTCTQEEAELRADAQISDENKFYSDLIGKKATELIGKVDNHATEVSKENTSIGSRISRLNLVYNRLQDDKINYEDLKSENDYVDVGETYIKLQSMLSVYQSALQTGANIIKMSLVNFI